MRVFVWFLIYSALPDGFLFADEFMNDFICNERENKVFLPNNARTSFRDLEQST